MTTKVKMLIVRINGKVFVFLKNPKCASTTLGHYLKILADRYEVLWTSKSKHSIKASGGDYSHPLYNHCNLKGAVKILKSLGEDPSKATIITTVREPVSKLISVYFHELKGKPYLWHRRKRPDFEHLVLHWHHTKSMRPEAFRCCGDLKANHLIRVEAFDEDFRKLNDLYEWGLDIKPSLKKNKGRPKVPVPVSQSLKEKIREIYALDYVDGGYL